MKKLVLSLAILGFVAFGVLSVQNLAASSHQTVMVKYDKDPKKDNNKKTADTKDVKADSKTAESDSKSGSSSCASSCSDKSSTSKSCCSGEKSSCCGSSASPDKK
jgi:hypothetical protein